LHNREVGRLFAFDDATGIDTDLAISIREVASVAQPGSALGALRTSGPLALIALDRRTMSGSRPLTI